MPQPTFHGCFIHVFAFCKVFNLIFLDTAYPEILGVWVEKYQPETEAEGSIAYVSVRLTPVSLVASKISKKKGWLFFVIIGK
jgi:hypothetical protein